MENKEYTLYILECKDNKLYTGITNDLIQRLEKHKSGKGSKFVRANLPFKLVYTENNLDRSQALKRELEIKNLTKREKIELIMPMN